jgi:hypothetical protein
VKVLEKKKPHEINKRHENEKKEDKKQRRLQQC